MTITYALSDEEFREVWIYARYKHVGGRHPESAMMKMLAFDLMRKYRVPDEAKAKLEKLFYEELRGAKAVQPEGLQKELGAASA